MKNLHSQHLTRGSVLTLVVVSALFGAVPLFVYEAQELPNSQTGSATLVLKQFPGLEWSKPSPEQVSVVLGEKTEKERLVLATGQKSSAISTTPISKETFAFYDKEFKSKGFFQEELVGDPTSDIYWVAHYHKDQQYTEIEYYPTPYKTNSFTIVLFFGVLPKDD